MREVSLLARKIAQLGSDRDGCQSEAGIGEIFRMVAEHLRGRADFAGPGVAYGNLRSGLLEQESGPAEQDRQ